MSGVLNWTVGVVVNCTLLLFWPDTCGQLVFYNALQKRWENCDSLSIIPAWAVDRCQTEAADTENGQRFAMGKLEPYNFFFLFLSLKGGIIIHTPSNPVILFEVKKAVLQFGAPFLINKVQGRISRAK